MEIDKALINACANGDRKAQFELYNQSFPALMNVAFRYYNNRDDASAIVNQCFLKVLKGLPSFIKVQTTASYIVWIRKIMTNTLIDEYRKNGKKKEITQKIDDEVFLESISPEEYNDIEKFIEDEALYEMLSKLTEIQRNVFNLFAIDGYSHKEIGDALIISETNSKWHLSQARKKLQSELKMQVNKQKHEHNV